MAYLGGKATGARHILKVLNNSAFDGFDYIEPFVGMAHVLRRVTKKRSYLASDDSALLVTLLLEIQKNATRRWPSLTKEEYDRLRRAHYANALRQEDVLSAACAAYTFSYMGVQWGGYCPRSGARNYVEERIRYYSRLHSNASFQAAVVAHADYRTLRGMRLDDARTLIYCDPPYANPKRHASTPADALTYGTTPFDSALFWEFVRDMSRRGVAVLVSEYSAPDDFKVVAHEFKRQTAGRSRRERVTQNLYVHRESWVVDALLEGE